MVQRQNMPELLNGILELNPNVFNGPQANRWNNHNYTPKFNGLSPSGNYAQYSPQNSVQSSPLPSPGASVSPLVSLPSVPGPAYPIASAPTHLTSKPSNPLSFQTSPHVTMPSPHVNMASPPSQSRFLHPMTSTPQNHIATNWDSNDALLDSMPQHSQTVSRASVITEQKTSHHMQVSPMQVSPIQVSPNVQNGGYFNSPLPGNDPYNNQHQQSMNIIMNMSQDNDPLSISPQHQPNLDPQPTVNIQEELFRRQGMLIKSSLVSIYVMDYKSEASH